MGKEADWTQLSIDFANQRNYLDELFKIYPAIPEGIREIDGIKWKAIEKAFKSENKVDLLKLLLSLDLFPIKDSYVAYLKRDKSSIERNPNEWTIIHVKEETRNKVNIRTQQEKLKNVDELINKLLKLKGKKSKS